MSAPVTLRAAPAPTAAAGRPAARGRAAAPVVARRVAGRLRNEWLPRAAWTISRTGRSGLAGIALLLAAGLFLTSTHLQVAADVKALRAELATAQRRARTAPGEVADPAAAVHALPARTEVPAILRQLFEEAARARLAVDSARYEITAATVSDVVRYQIAFPVTGPYPQLRAFLDRALATMPALALRELALDRKAIGEGNVEAQIRMTLYTRSTP